jgi:RNA polymerase sigma-70 factor (ECF subfamily)
MDWKEASDADLMRAIGEQEMVAFNTLYDRYSRLVFSTAYRVLNDAGAAEDVVQDVYVRLWQRPERYVEERGRFIGWLLSVTRNRAIDEIRSRGRRPLSETQVSGGDVTSSITAEAPSPSAAREMESAEMVDQREAVRAALDELPYDQRIAIELAYFKGLTQAEIAETLDTPLGTIKTRVRLGMRKLRVALEGKVGLIEPSPSADRSHD